MIIIIQQLASPADIARKSASPARGSLKGIHTGERYTPASEMDLVSLNIAAPVRSVKCRNRQSKDSESQQDEH